MKSFTKSAFRLFSQHVVRLITIIAIVAVSIGVSSGIAELQNRITVAENGFYKERNVSDLYVKSARVATLPNGSVVPVGFTAEETDYLAETYGEENLRKSFYYETKNDDGEITRVCTLDFSDDKINKFKILEGRLPQNDGEILTERKTEQIKAYEIGDKVTVAGAERTVCGVVENPLMQITRNEPSLVYENEYLTYTVYLHQEQIPVVNDVYITLTDRELFDGFSRKYEKEIGLQKQKLGEYFQDNAAVLSLYENVGIYSMVSYAEKVGIIAVVFVVFFLLVAMLITYSGMSRLFAEERPKIACLKTLGYADNRIINRYVLFVAMGTFAGGAIGLPIGIGLTYLLYVAFNQQYAMPPFPGVTSMWYYMIIFAVTFVPLLLLTYFTGKVTVREKPVQLMTYKAPKSGKKVFLEKIPALWSKISFKYKSTLRNTLLFKSRFFMTVIAIIGSTVLLLAGLGLMDCAMKEEGAESIVAIALALVAFSAALCALVLYNITNVNVSERNREIATLMVLGYHDGEVTGYIFREIYIMCAVGAVLGVPFGAAFMQFVFSLIDFGTLADINWWSWLLAPVITMAFSFLSTMMLRKKITKTDMNASLKTLE
ncbi:MAG: ABC transporter permease [Corallococcus sp.]|nr:ABC transporter permease [Corallococcus sp.]MCM1359983.1 ABC transporter permease [Corallococcus sp.]MCM1395540.1 ABC transporter permease [Corallococcus sp.]